MSSHGHARAGMGWGGSSKEEDLPPLRDKLRDRALLGRTVHLFSPYRRTVAIVAILILLTSGLGALSPVLIKYVFDDALFVKGGPDIGRLIQLTSFMVLLPIITGLLSVWQTYLTTSVGQSVLRDLRARLYGHLQSLALRFFTRTKTGEIQSRLSNDVGGLQSVITNTLSSILSNTVTLISTVVAMLILSWKLTALSLCLLPVFLFITRRVGRARRDVSAKTQNALAEMSAITEETLSVSGVLLSKLFGRQANEQERYGAQNTRLAELEVRQQMIGRGFFALVTMFFSAMPAAVYLAAGFTSGISAGTLVAVTTLQARLFMPIGQLLQVSTEVSSSLALFERIFGYLDLEPDITDAPDAVDLPVPAKGAVKLDNVSFVYEGTHKALDGVTLDIQPGTLAAIVGPSGAGKTTISYLIPRLYDATDGSVLLDGIDVRKLTSKSIAGAVSMVTQDSYLFHASVIDNIRYGSPSATDEQVQAAATAAQMHERIMQFDNGYDTIVGERGYRLSGGEKQRVAIARVILRDPRILILDEATSALDTRNERLVQTALRPLMKDRTTIAIAHRLSTIRAADVIFVLDSGRVVERGKHEDLASAGGLYASLYHAQYGDGLVEAMCSDGFVLSSGATVELEQR